MAKSALPHLYRIRDSIIRIETYTTNFTLDSFKSDDKTQDAVIKQIENIGEEVSKLEKAYLKIHPQLPWSEMIATRNKLVHDYWDINPKRVWEIVLQDIPSLKRDLLPILKELQAHEANDRE